MTQTRSEFETLLIEICLEFGFCDLGFNRFLEMKNEEFC